MTADSGYASTPYSDTGMPDPAALPEAYEGVLWRRTAAYFVDLFCIGVIALFVGVAFLVLWVMSLGLLGPVLWFCFGLIPLAYHTLLLSGPASATICRTDTIFQACAFSGRRAKHGIPSHIAGSRSTSAAAAPPSSTTRAARR